MCQKAQGPDYTGLFQTSASKRRLLQLDLYVHTRRKVQLHQRVDRLVGRVDDVHQALMSADFHLVTRGLVHVRRTQQVKTLNAGRQGHRTTHHRASALGSFNDLKRRLIDQAVVKGLQSDTNFLILHDIS